jgi:fluoroquinolone transport system permease protein
MSENRLNLISLQQGFFHRLFSGLRWEIVLQWRNGFYAATFFLMAIWALLATQIPHLDLRAYLPGILAGNLLVGSFYFMAGLVMLERTEGSLTARVVTPLRIGEYLLVKALALGLLALMENLLVLILLVGFHFALLPAVLGLLLATGLLSLAGFFAAARYDSINAFLLPSILFVLGLMLPLLDSFGLLHSWAFALHPLQAALVLLQGAFRPLTAWEWIYSLGYGAAALAGLGWLCRKAFRRFIVGE